MLFILICHKEFFSREAQVYALHKRGVPHLGIQLKVVNLTTKLLTLNYKLRL